MENTNKKCQELKIEANLVSANKNRGITFVL